MAKWAVWCFALLGPIVENSDPEARQITVSVTPRASAARSEGVQFGSIPYVLRVEGLQLPEDRSSRLTIYGEAPSKDAPVLGTVEGMGWSGGPKSGLPHNMVIPLSQDARRYLVGKKQVTLWILCEGLTELRFSKVIADISLAR